MPVIAEIVDAVQGARIQIGNEISSNPASIGAGAIGTATLTIAGADATDLVFLTPRALATGLVMRGATVTGNNTVTVTLFNPTAGAIDDAASAYDYILVKRAD